MVDQRFSVSVHIMTSIAFHQTEKPEDSPDDHPHLVTSEYLASSIRTNPTVVRRLVSRLASAGLVKSYKGKAGGVKLARPAQEITLKDIYLACSDKKLLSASEKAPKKHCPVSCSMKKLMNEVIDGVESNSVQYLASIPLSSLLKKITQE